MRPSWDTTFMTLARTMAERGTCPRLQVGAVIVSPEDHLVLATGYNGAPSGLPHCEDQGCLLEAEGTGVREHCIRAVHAETNAITSAAKHGIRINGAVLYCLYLPCSRCANMIKTAGITEVVYQLGYKDSGLEHLGIKVRRYAPEKDPGGVFYGRRKFDERP